MTRKISSPEESLHVWLRGTLTPLTNVPFTDESSISTFGGDELSRRRVAWTPEMRKSLGKLCSHSGRRPNRKRCCGCSFSRIVGYLGLSGVSWHSRDMPPQTHTKAAGVRGVRNRSIGRFRVALASDLRLAMAKPRPPAPPPAPAPDAIAQLAQKAKETPVLLAVLLVVGALLYTLLKGKKKASAGGKFLNKQRQSLVLGERRDLSHDTVRFRFLLPKATPVLGLPVGKHFKLYCPAPTGKVKGQWNGREDPEEGCDEIERKYTPCTSDDEVGYVDLVVKVYKGGVLDRFPDGGKMSQYLSTLKVGDSISISGPWGMNEYVGKGTFLIGKREVHCKKLGMLAGGTGITPMLQVMSAILKDAADPTKISLLFANQSEDDILVRHMLEELQTKHPDRLKVWYTVDRPPPRWKYSSGFITATMISDHLPPPGDDTLVLMCGPPPMVKFACLENLNQLGYAKEKLVVF